MNITEWSMVAFLFLVIDVLDNQRAAEKWVVVTVKGMEIPDSRECTAPKDLKTGFVVKKTGES